MPGSDAEADYLTESKRHRTIYRQEILENDAEMRRYLLCSSGEKHVRPF